MNFPIPLPAFNIIIKTLVVTLALALISEKWTHLKAIAFASGDTWAALTGVSTFCFTLLPQAFYLLGLWAASTVFARLAKGDAFGPSLVKGLRGVGSNLIYGAAAAIVIVPTILPMLQDRFRGIRYDAEIESFTIGLIGVVLYLLAKQGQRLKSELEQFV